MLSTEGETRLIEQLKDVVGDKTLKLLVLRRFYFFSAETAAFRLRAHPKSQSNAHWPSQQDNLSISHRADHRGLLFHMEWHIFPPSSSNLGRKQ